MKNLTIALAIIVFSLILSPQYIFAEEDEMTVKMKALCEEGNGTACFKVGERYRVVEQDPKSAVPYFIKACDGDHYTGCTHAGILIQSQGLQYSKQWKQAAKLFKKSCDVDSDRACFNLGSLKYREGRQKAAAKYYKKACDLGNQQACHNHSKVTN